MQDKETLLIKWRMHRRIVGVSFGILLAMTAMLGRLYRLQTSDCLSAAAQAQGNYHLTVATTRGTIYDRSGIPLVNSGYRYAAAVVPTPAAASALLKNADADADARTALLEQLQSGMPFVLALEDENLYADGIDVFRLPERYGAEPYAVHLIGYLNDGKTGAAGLERAFDALLTEAGGEIGVSYHMDAGGQVMEDTVTALERSGENPVGGVVLTLDSGIQRVVQRALAERCERGAAVVLDVNTGEILAMASVPTFDPNNIADSLDAEDAPFFNRAASAYSIGSVFKLLVSAAALEQGCSSGYAYECTGSIEVGGQTFHCNNNKAHGSCDMQRALEVSCNCYFIHLAQEVLAPETLLEFARNMGLGSSTELAPDLYTQAGSLPTLEELQMPAGYANFSFGQGSSLATPLQIAQAVAALANGGLAVTPKLVLGTTEDGSTVEQTEAYAQTRVLSEDTAEELQRLMRSVVENGSGQPAQPESGGAGGKTSSAQTGQYAEDTGEEIVHAWFAGFYPAQEPEVAIAVFVEDGKSGEQAAAPIFQAIANGLLRLS